MIRYLLLIKSIFFIYLINSFSFLLSPSDLTHDILSDLLLILVYNLLNLIFLINLSIQLNRI